MALERSMLRDPHWDSCVWAMQYGAADSIGTDKSPAAATFTAGADAALSTGQTKFAAQSIIFDGTGDKVTDGTAAATWASRANNDHTFQAWVYHDVAVANETYFETSVETSAANYVLLERSVTTGYLNIALSGGAISGSTAIPATTWTHVAYTRRGNGFFLFVDGVLGNSGTVAETIGTSVNHGVLGYNEYSSGAGFAGYIGQAYFHTKALWTSNFTLPTRARPLRKHVSGVRS